MNFKYKNNRYSEWFYDFVSVSIPISWKNFNLYCKYPHFNFSCNHVFKFLFIIVPIIKNKFQMGEIKNNF